MSLYRRLHEVQQAPTAPGGAAGRDPVLNDLRHKIHQRLIEELGRSLRKPTGAGGPQRKVHEQLHAGRLRTRAAVGTGKAQYQGRLRRHPRLGTVDRC